MSAAQYGKEVLVGSLARRESWRGELGCVTYIIATFAHNTTILFIAPRASKEASRPKWYCAECPFKQKCDQEP